LPDIRLGAGAPPLVQGIYELTNLATEGFARPAQALVDALGNLIYSWRDSVPVPRGGSYSDVRGTPGFEAHHMPSDSISPLPTSQGPAISMDKDEHRQTASWGVHVKLARIDRSNLA